MIKEAKIVFGGLILTIVAAKLITLIFGISMTSPFILVLSLVAGCIIGDLLTPRK